jgi:Fe-S-cluster containining protein
MGRVVIPIAAQVLVISAPHHGATIVADARDKKNAPVSKSRADGDKWYAAGLAFECQQSGNCCSGAPGYVWVTKAEVRAIAKHLGRSDQWLGKEHLRRVGWRLSLTERPDGDCVFLERRNGRTFCRIHQVKPNQCRQWPFWTSNLKSPEAWNAAAQACPGMNRGRRHDFVEIESIRLQRPPT